MVTDNECAANRAVLEKEITSIRDLVQLNSDLAVLKTFSNDIQFQAYNRLKKHQERMQFLKDVTKIAAIINALVGALTVILEILI